MVTLTINRKPQGIFSKSPATPLQDKTNTVHNEKLLRVRNQTPWRHMTKRQRKNRKRINRLVELWPELFNREKPKPLKVGIPDDLIQDIAIRELARYNLNGQPCGEVTPQEQKEAETRLMMLNDRRKDRKPR
ncbi:ProQ/FINO family protein [Escherichia coli]|uniref:ProQ/FINO family protein n=1 Tax=Escherichia coli TaxID=562 RepID=UPI000DF4B5DC|nr:ProQ/FINO family protein [Escherichia coli]RCY11586.1 proQ/FINO family protein [Escherichia coli]